MRIFKLLFIGTLPLLLFAESADAKPNVKLKGQDQPRWCWAATAEMTMRALSNASDIIRFDQCWIVNAVYRPKEKDCCENPSSDKCNRAGTVANALSKYMYTFNTAVATDGRVLTPKALLEQIESNRPVPFTWVDTRGGDICGAHASVVVDVFTIKNVFHVRVFDPRGPRDRLMTYDQWVSGRGGNGRLYRVSNALYNIKGGA